MLRLLPSHENYRTVDGSIVDPVRVDKTELHLQYLVQGEPFNTGKTIFLTTKPLKGVATLPSLLRLLGLMASSVLLVNSNG